MTGRSSYNRRCEQLRPLQMLDDGNVFVPAWKDIDRIRRAAKVYFHHLNRKYKDKNISNVVQVKKQSYEDIYTYIVPDLS